MKAVTQWFPPEVKPVHVGLYERNYSFEEKFKECPWRDFFDGEKWMIIKSDGSEVFPALGSLPWRGLADKP